MKPEKLESVFAKRKAKEIEKQKNAPKTEAKNLVPFVERFGQSVLDGWKKENGNRDLIYLKAEDFLAVLRPPLAEDLGDYMTAIATNGLSKAVAMVIEQLWLDGDFQLIEDEDLFIAVFLQINGILEGKKAEFFRT